MKYLIASDIHGSAYYCQKLINAIEFEKPDKILLLGDILYHGPRNDLPKEYDPKAVISMLNPLREKIYCVRGNCDSEVDQMVLDFSILSDSMLIVDGPISLYCTHGHLKKYAKNAIVLQGHTHVPAFSFDCLNPGSVSIPKENSPHSYMTLEDCIFTWKDVNDLSQYHRIEYQE